MKRIIISASQFKLSAAGVNVDSASGNNLIFDGFNSGAYNGVFLSGSVPGSSLVQQSGYWNAIIGFGKTFATPPQAMVRIINTDGGSLLRDYFNQRASSSDGTNVIYYVSTTQLEVQIHYSGSTFNPRVGFSYFICQV